MPSPLPGRALPAALLAVLAVAALAAPAADAKFPAGVVFAHKRAAVLKLSELQTDGKRFRLCNTTASSTRVTAVFDGFGFEQDAEPLDEERLLSVDGLPDDGMLGGGDCSVVTLRAAPEETLDPGSYSGTFAFVSKGAGIARVRVEVTVAAPKQTSARTHVALERNDYGGLRVATTVRARIPRGTPGLRPVLLADAGRERRDSVNRLLASIGLPGVYYSPYGPSAKLALDRSWATLTVPMNRDMYSFDRGAFDSGDVEPAPGDVRVSRAGKLVKLDLWGPDPDSGTAWVAEVEAPAARQQHFEPPPDRRYADLLRWTYPAGMADARASVKVKLEPGVRRTLVLGNKVPQALRAGAFFLSNAVFVVLLLILLRRDAGEGAARARLRRVAWAAIVLLAGMLALWLLQTFTMPTTWRDPSQSEAAQAAGLFARLAIPALVAVPLLSVALDADRLFTRRAARAAAGILVLGALATLGVTTRSTADLAPGPLEHHAVRWVLAATGPAIALLLSLLLFVATAQIVRRTWPPGRVRQLAGRIPIAWVWVGITALAAGVAAQWAWNVYAHYSDVPLEVHGTSLAWWEALSGDIAFWPLGMLGRFSDLLPLLLAVAALPLLRQYADPSRSEFALSKSSHPILLLVLIFAGVVAGTGGALEGFRVPLAFALALVFLWLLLRDRSDGAGTGRLSHEQRRERINAGLKREEYRRKQGELYEKLTKGEKGLREFHGELARLRKPPAETDPLSRGVFDDWWCNAKSAARLGAYASVAPLAYYIAVIVVDRIGDDLSRHSVFGLLDLLFGLTAEAATWIVAAFVFGGLYAHLPGRQGPAKGALLAAVFAAALGLSALVLPDNHTWAFRSLEMLLFLGVVGFLIDRRTVEYHGFYWREVLDLYHVRETRFAAGYVSGVGAALLAVFQQVLTGNGADTVKALLEAAGGVLPGPGG